MIEQDSTTNENIMNPKVMAISIMALIAIFFGLIAYLIAVAPLKIPNDVGLFIHLGERMLNGQVPYVDFFDIAPPTVYVITIPAVLMEQFTGLDSIFWLQTQMLLMTILSCIVTWYLGKDLWTEENSLYNYIIPFTMAGVVLLLWVTHNTHAQRSHNLLILYLPGLLLRLRSWRGIQNNTILAFVLGFISAIAISIKPYFLLIPLLTEVYMLLRYRRWKALWSAEVIGFITYSVAFLTYFVTQPRVIEGVIFLLDFFPSYASPRIKFDVFFADERLQFAFFLFIIFWIVRLVTVKQDNNPLENFEVLTIFGIAGTIALIMQSKNFNYHWIITQYTSWMLLVLLLVVAVKAVPYLKRYPILVFVAVWLYIVGLVVNQFDFRIAREPYEPYGATAVLENYTNPDETVMFIVFEVGFTYPAVIIANRQNVASFTHTPFAYERSWLEGEPSEFIEGYFDITRSDLIENNPRLVLMKRLDLQAMEYSGIMQDLIAPNYALVWETVNDLAFVNISDFPISDSPYRFDNILELEGWRYSDTITPCTNFELETVWSAIDDSSTPYSMTLVMTDANGNAVSQIDGVPSTVQTNTWRDDWRYFDVRSFDVPCDLPTGDYNVLISVYDPFTNDSNLPITNSDGVGVGDYLWLTGFNVTE